MSYRFSMQNSLQFLILASWIISKYRCQDPPAQTFASSSELLRQTIVTEVDTGDVEGKSSGEVVIERVVAYPQVGNTDEVTLRNIGGQTVDLTGWVLTDNKGAQDQYKFGKTGCVEQAILKPGFSVILYPFSEEEPCGFDFGISFADNLTLYNPEGILENTVSWPFTSRGIAMYRTEEGQYINIPEGTETVIGVLSQIPDFSYFLDALKFHSLYDLLKAPNDPKNLEPFIPQSPEPNYFQMIEWPWFFGYAADREDYPKPSPPPSPPPFIPGVPELGPYTLLVPTNQAFQNSVSALRTTVRDFIRRPETLKILEYHILGGGYSSQYMFNNTPIVTTHGQDILVIRDPKQIEGTIGFMDTCIDVPTAQYSCQEQKDFGKCYEPFMVSPLTAQWQGGFCERTCGRCNCDKYPCVQVQFADIMATNGVIHSIDRIMFPAKKFQAPVSSPVVEDPDMESGNLTEIQQEAELPELPELPSFATGLPGPGGRKIL